MKKKTPLELLKALEEFVPLNNEKFKVVDNEKYLISVVDIESDSDFHFNVEGLKNDRDASVLISFKPYRKDKLMSKRAWIKPNEIKNYFSDWINLLDEYDSVTTFFDDPIIESFAKEYIDGFKLLEGDSKTAPFNINQILLLDSHLEDIESKINTYQNKENVKQIDEIKRLANEIRLNLTSKSKDWVVKKLAFLWGTITKQGVKIFKNVVLEGQKQLIAKGIKYIIESALD